jgi:copper chaperone CopZ
MSINQNQQIMRTRVLSLLMLMGLSSLTLFAGPVKTEKFKVGGKCSMCKARIEKAANSVDGVSAAEWNVDTKMIEVSFDEAKTSIQKVHEAIAEVGHDTELIKADDETYDNLPSCCHYDRLAYDSSNSSDTGHENHAGHMH